MSLFASSLGGGRLQCQVAIGRRAEQPAQQLLEQVVVTEQCALMVERNEQQVRGFDAFQHRRGVGPAGERVHAAASN